MISQASKLDTVALKTFECLLRDFRRLEGQDFARGAEKALLGGIKEFREYEWPTLGEMSPNRYKAWWQLQHLFKRYRFTCDAFTDDELDKSTYRKYIDFQTSRSVYAPFKPSTVRVLREARRVAREILGDFSHDEFHHSCKIGKRATLGGARSTAYIDNKLGQPEMLTCPSTLKKWFFETVSGDPHLKSIVKSVFKRRGTSGTGVDFSVDYLNLVLVPKSWKTHRCITPLSLIGLYFSYGVGEYVTKRLREHGLDIKKLQSRHRKLARRFSGSRSHATADLSSASDSLRSDILNAVLPRSVYTMVKKTFVRRVRISGVEYYTESVLPMGNGATFPVETLVFYCLIKAIGNLTSVKGTYSVYGDDLIYPVRIHPYVLGVFQDLGIGINGDKTFVSSHFRESCGSDFYRGFDVRPAMLPERPSSQLNRLRYCQYLYKVINSLLRRWHELEIPTTITWLLKEVLSASNEVFQVPPHFPDTAGVHTEVPRFSWYIPWAQPKSFFKDGSAWVSFRFIGEVAAKRRPVVSELPFYWDTLRSISSRTADWRASYGWFRDLGPQSTAGVDTGSLKSIWLKRKRVVTCASLETGYTKNMVCTVSNWT